MEAFADVTKLVEAVGLVECWEHTMMSQPIRFNKLGFFYSETDLEMDSGMADNSSIDQLSEFLIYYQYHYLYFKEKR